MCDNTTSIDYCTFQHSNIKLFFDERTQVINSGLEAFTTDIKAQNAWNDVTVIMVSEFARTLTGNTGKGSDHAWGGNYWIAGGEVRGKTMLGEYPTSLDDGPLIFQPGIVIPTTPWDALWNGVAQWLGITDANVSCAGFQFQFQRAKKY